jgi:DNA-binding winged helix-turn-helix (wHTH) protein
MTLYEQVQQLRDQIAERDEVIRQLKARLVPPKSPLHVLHWLRPYEMGVVIALYEARHEVGHETLMAAGTARLSYHHITGQDSLRVHIHSIRNKLKARGAPVPGIHTIKGVGYQMSVECKRWIDAQLDKREQFKQAARGQSSPCLGGK